MSLIITSINTNFFFKGKEDLVAEKLSKIKTDVILFTEVRKDIDNYVISENEFKLYFKGGLGLSNITKNGEFVLASNKKIVKPELGYYEAFQYSELEYEEQIIGIYSIHLMPYFVFKPHFHFHETDVQTKNTFRIRSVQLKVMLNHIDSNQGSFIVIGDLNSFGIDKVAMSLSKRLIKLNPKKFNKATFPSKRPLLRMDYCFVSSDLEEKVETFDYIIDENVSDHAMLRVELI